MPRKPSKQVEVMEALGQLVLQRDWICIHGLSMQVPCIDCLAAVKREAETQHLQIAEEIEAVEERDDGE